MFPMSSIGLLELYATFQSDFWCLDWSPRILEKSSIFSKSLDRPRLLLFVINITPVRSELDSDVF